MVVGHPFLAAYNQRKYVAMKRLDKTLRLRLVVPTRWRERFEPTDWQVHPELGSEEVVPLKPHLAHSHMTYVHAPRSLAAILRHFQPNVIHIEEEPQSLITLETVALRSAFAPRAAISLFTWDNILRERPFPLGPTKLLFRRFSLRWTSLVICGNRRAADLLRAEGCFQGQVENLPQYGLEVSEHQPGTEPELRNELKLQSGAVVGYIGRLVPEKGLRILLESLEGLLNYPWQLLLVGSGPLEPEIRQQWMARLHGRVILHPAVSYNEVPRYLRCTDIFVLASQSTPTWEEQFGLSLAQAMMVGVASIGARCGAIPDTLVPGGTIVEQHDVEGLRHALETFLTSPAQRERAVGAGRDYALKNYTIESIAAQYLDAFEKARSCHSTGHNEVSESLEMESLRPRV